MSRLEQTPEFQTERAATASLLQQTATIANLPNLKFSEDMLNIYNIWFCDDAHGYLQQNYPLVTPQVGQLIVS